jgi:hypothetical protein
LSFLPFFLPSFLPFFLPSLLSPLPSPHPSFFFLSPVYFCGGSDWGLYIPGRSPTTESQRYSQPSVVFPFKKYKIKNIFAYVLINSIKS